MGAMDHVTLLVLESDSAAGLSGEVCAILDGSSHLDLRHAPFRENPPRTPAPDAVMAVVGDGGSDSATILRTINTWFPTLPVLVVGEFSEPDRLIELLESGATDFVTPPLKSAEILSRLWRAIDLNRRRQTLTGCVKERLGLKQLVGVSASFREQTSRIPFIASCDASVLITGETGTGKEMCARAIHYLSARADHAFVPVNCGAIPLELVENELFGHQRGAYTGATTSQAGLIGEADGGTLFLDEIDSLPALAQVKLLRFLQEKEYRQIGSPKTHKADVRVIAATNTDLDAALRNGKLRRDLYYRLNVIPLMLPPLSERTDDIPILARHFLARYALELNKTITEFSAEALEALVMNSWPGNVRELQNAIERAIVMSSGPVITLTDVQAAGVGQKKAGSSFQEAKAALIANFERRYIEGLLISHNGNISSAARAANKNRRAFWQLIRKHGIDVQSYRT